MNDEIMFGFQYYRAPTPRKENWEKDLKKIAADGFNTVKYWVQWRWGNPAPGVYRFDDLDELMLLAEKYGLKVVLNLILDVAPAWLYLQYPDCAMQTNAGEILHPSATLCRQGGGTPGPCFNHEAANRLKYEFTAVAARHFKNFKALDSWDIWNEPELTVALKRDIDIKDFVCYCDHCRADFHRWLKEKYDTIDALNESWGRNYNNFDEAELPRIYGTVNDMIDWRLYFVDVITRDAAERARIIRQEDPGREISCHTVTMPCFNAMTCASDDWDIAEVCDAFGNSSGSSAFSSRLLGSAAKGKKMLNSEIHGVSGYTMTAHKRPDMQDVLRHTLLPLSNGSRGFLYWQYRPEVLGMEAPAWGSVDLEGKDTPWHKHIKEVNDYIQRNAEDINKNPFQKGNAAIYLDPENEIYTWNTTLDKTLYYDSVMGAFELLCDNNLDVDFIRRRDLDDLSRYKIILFPCFYYGDSAMTEKITDWIAGGGTAVFEPFAGIVDRARGDYEPKTPGLGLSEKLGVRLTKIVSSEMISNGYYPEVRHYETDYLPIDCSGVTVYGSKFIIENEIESERVQVIGKYANGLPAVYQTPFGRGRAVLFNSLFCATYTWGKKDNAKFMQFFLPEGDYRLRQQTGLRINELVCRQKRVLVVDNNTETDQVLDLPYAEPRAVFGREFVRKCGEKTVLAAKKIAVFETNL